MSAMRAKALRWLAWSPDNLVFAWEIGRFRTSAALSRTYPPESMVIFAQLPWSKWTIRLSSVAATVPIRLPFWSASKFTRSCAV